MIDRGPRAVSEEARDVSPEGSPEAAASAARAEESGAAVSTEAPLAADAAPAIASAARLQSDPAVALARRALAESVAATAILLDRDAWASAAVVHVLDGWQAVVDALAPGSTGLLAERLASTPLPGLEDAERLRLAGVLRRLADAPRDRADAVDRGEVRWAVRALHATASKVLRARGGRTGAWRWAVAAAAGAAVVGALVWIGGAGDLGDASGSGWLARYYPELDFGGEPVVRYDPAIDFDWLGDAPAADVPADRYTVRWDSCLELPADDVVELRIGSDDGSRVFVDGEQVIDSWRDQAGNWASRRAELDAGVHHLRVEYYENGGNALAILELKTAAGPVPAEWLRPPRLRGGDVACAQ